MRKSLKQLREKIESDNIKFNNLSNEEKCVEVARDLLHRLDIDQFQCNDGVVIYNLDEYSASYKDSVKDIVNNKLIPECEVCAKGGLLLSYVGRINDFIINNTYYGTEPDEKISKKLAEIFNPIDLELIETVYEGTVIHGEYGILDHLSDDYINKIIKLYKGYNQKQKLRSIAKNIIKHNGRFIPENLVKPNERIF
jgi:hypothetical protein